MDNPPKTAGDFWIRFFCSFVFFGALITFISFKLLSAQPLILILISSFLVTLILSIFLGHKGDRIWKEVLEFITLLAWWS